jgi:hypothetical protein
MLSFAVNRKTHQHHKGVSMKETMVATEYESGMSWPSGSLSLFSWRSILAGAALSLIFYILFLALGAGIAALNIDSRAVSDRSDVWEVATGIWIFAASGLALFLGTFFATRCTESRTSGVGALQGGVITSIFYLLVLLEAGSLLGGAGRFVSSLVSGTGSAVSSGVVEASMSPAVHETVEHAIEGLHLKDSTEDVVKTVGVRLFRGDVDGATTYLARQTGRSPDEVRDQVKDLESQVTAAVDRLRRQTAATVSAAGFSLFGLILVGLLSAMVGGALAGHRRSVEF